MRLRESDKTLYLVLPANIPTTLIIYPGASYLGRVRTDLMSLPKNEPPGIVDEMRALLGLEILLQGKRNNILYHPDTNFTWLPKWFSNLKLVE